MSVWSARRQFTLFLLIFLLIAVPVGFLVWQFWPEPSCLDGRQNQGELGIDCGGVCEAVCASEALLPRVLWTRVLPSGFGAYDLVALVENPNPDLALVNQSYTFNFVDDDNLFINEVKGSLALAPSSRFVVFVSEVNAGRRIPARAQFEFNSAPSWRRVDDKPTFSTDNYRFHNLPTPLLLAGLVNQSDNQAYKNIAVAVILSDAKHNAFAAATTFVEEFAAGASTELSFTWPRAFETEPIFIELYPQADPLNYVADPFHR